MPSLSPAELPRHLLAHGLLTSRDVVERGVLVTERSRSHSVLVVAVGDGDGLVVKQAAPEHGGDPARLCREADLYAAAATRPGLRAVIPRCPHASPGRLVLEYTPGETLLEHHHRPGPCDPAVSRALGAALGSAHRALADDPPNGFAGPLPWVLDALEAGGDASFAWEDARIAAALQAVPEPVRVHEALAEARARWRVEHVIHGDLKWDNVLLADPVAPTVRIIDWELATVGDPAWDLAGALQEYSALGVARGEDPVGHGDAVAALWAGYLDAAGPAVADVAGLVARSERFAGARLLQTACEVARQHGAGAPAVPALVGLASDLLTRGAPVTPAPAAA